MGQLSEVEIFEYQGSPVKIILVEQPGNLWIVGVEVSGKRVTTTNSPFADKSEARNYGHAVARSEVANLH